MEVTWKLHENLLNIPAQLPYPSSPETQHKSQPKTSAKAPVTAALSHKNQQQNHLQQTPETIVKLLRKTTKEAAKNYP